MKALERMHRGAINSNATDIEKLMPQLVSHLRQYSMGNIPQDAVLQDIKEVQDLLTQTLASIEAIEEVAL